jgi:ribosomal protein L37AE/L43A
MNESLASLTEKERECLAFFLKVSPRKVFERDLLASSLFSITDVESLLKKKYLVKREIRESSCPECKSDISLKHNVKKAYCRVCHKDFDGKSLDFYEYYISNSEFQKILEYTLFSALSTKGWTCVRSSEAEKNKLSEILFSAEKGELSCCFTWFNGAFVYKDYLALKGFLEDENTLFGFVLAPTFDNLSITQITQSPRIFSIDLADIQGSTVHILDHPEEHLKRIDLTKVLKREFELYDVDKEILSVSSNLDNLLFETEALAHQDQRLLACYGGIQKASKKFEKNTACLLKLFLRVYPLGGANQPDGLISFGIKGKEVGFVYDCKSSSHSEYAITKEDYQDMINNINIRHNKDISSFIDIRGGIFVSHAFNKQNIENVSQKIEAETGTTCFFLPVASLLELSKGFIENLVDTPNKPDYEDTIYSSLFNAANREITRDIARDTVNKVLVSDKKSKYFKDAFKVK